MSTEVTSQDDGRTESIRRGRLLEYLTIGWNLLEGAVAVGSGLIASSIALVGFGIDSFIESLSGAAPCGGYTWTTCIAASRRKLPH